MESSRLLTDGGSIVDDGLEPDGLTRDGVSTDGRRMRSADSRRRIIAAFLDLVREGQLSPSAEIVAVRAGVALRSVFRHFKDMDSLFQSMIDIIEKELMAFVEVPFRGQTWGEQLIEMVDRRGNAFGTIEPFLRAMTMQLDRSVALTAAYDRLTQVTRALIVMRLPESVLRDAFLVDALEVVLSFETWYRLRRRQGLSPDAVKAVQRGLVRRLVVSEMAK